MIPYGCQQIIQSDIDQVVEVLKSDFITQGPCVPAFEKAVSSNCGARYAVATNSATSALHLACLALGLGKGDVLWTSSITFVASANCALYCDAKVDFVDIDPSTYNMSVDALEKKLKLAEENGVLPKIVVPVHLCGQSCDMQTISLLAKKYNFYVIEDASHAIGGKYLNKPIGDCQYSDIAVFSFHPVKIITTGEGGMALTNNKNLANKMTLLRSHGITKLPELMTKVPDGDWFYQQIDLGYNYRMTDIQAALGISQLERLNEYVSSRNVLANRYSELLSDLDLTIPYQDNNNYSAFHLYVIRIQNKNKRKKTFNYLKKHNIGVNVHYIPVYHHPYYQDNQFDINSFPEAENYYSEAITIPLYPSMSYKDQDVVIKTLKEVL